MVHDIASLNCWTHLQLLQHPILNNSVRFLCGVFNGQQLSLVGLPIPTTMQSLLMLPLARRFWPTQPFKSTMLPILMPYENQSVAHRIIYSIWSIFSATLVFTKNKKKKYFIYFFCNCSKSHSNVMQSK